MNKVSDRKRATPEKSRQRSVEVFGDVSISVRLVVSRW